MAAFEDSVRPYQLPGNAPAQLYLSQYNLASQAPVTITPGFGAGLSGALPPIQTGSKTYTKTVASYMDQAVVEQTATEV